MKIFLLDFDGVVIDTLPIAVEVYNSLLTKYGIPKQFTPDDFVNLFLVNFHKGLAQTIPDEKIRKKILDERAEEYIRRKNDFRIFEGIQETLQNLSKDGKIIIISSNKTNFIKEFLNSRGINCITDVLGGDVEKSKIKKITWQKEKYPDAEIYYIGDTIGDIKEGKKAGVITVGVTWGFHSRELMEKEQPDLLFDKPSELSGFCSNIKVGP